MKEEALQSDAWWVLQYIINERDEYLTTRARIIRYIIEEGGMAINITIMSKKLGLTKTWLSKVCRDMEKTGILERKTMKGKSILIFSQKMKTDVQMWKEKVLK